MDELILTNGLLSASGMPRSALIRYISRITP